MVTGNRTELTLDVIYPVGSIYMSMNSTNPSVLFGGTWESIASGRVLMGADSSHSVGSTAEAGLPNITGGCIALGHTVDVTYGINTKDSIWNGSLYASGDYPCYGLDSTRFYNDGSKNSGFTFDASLSNSIYGNSTTVQPPALYCYMWKRTA